MIKQVDIKKIVPESIALHFQIPELRIISRSFSNAIKFLFCF
jgi:hypothetical protein